MNQKRFSLPAKNKPCAKLTKLFSRMKNYQIVPQEDLLTKKNLFTGTWNLFLRVVPLSVDLFIQRLAICACMQSPATAEIIHSDRSREIMHDTIMEVCSAQSKRPRREIARKNADSESMISASTFLSVWSFFSHRLFSLLYDQSSVKQIRI